MFDQADGMFARSICGSGSVEALAVRDIGQLAAALGILVHAVFFEDSPQFPREDKRVFVRGSIRKGRSDEQKAQIAERIQAALIEYGGLDQSETGVVIRETPASWVLEGGEIMPEPGDEAEWFAAQEARRQAEGV